MLINPTRSATPIRLNCDLVNVIYIYEQFGWIAKTLPQQNPNRVLVSAQNCQKSKGSLLNAPKQILKTSQNSNWTKSD